MNPNDQKIYRYSIAMNGYDVFINNKKVNCVKTIKEVSYYILLSYFAEPKLAEKYYYNFHMNYIWNIPKNDFASGEFCGLYIREVVKLEYERYGLKVSKNI